MTSRGPFADVAESVKFGGGLVHFVGGTPDLSHVVLQSEGPELIKGASLQGQGSLYEWDAGKLTLLSTTPAGTNCMGFVALGVAGGGRDHGLDSRNALSPNGSLAVWSNSKGAGACSGHLYLREVLNENTVQLDEVQHGVSNPGVPAAVYQDASVGDEHIFFTDSQRLTVGSNEQGHEDEEADLYEYDRASKTLVDMTVPVNAGEPAAVQGVLGASEDGADVYVVAHGVLTGTPNARKENAVSGQPNLYLLENVAGVWRPAFITTAGRRVGRKRLAGAWRWSKNRNWQDRLRASRRTGSGWRLCRSGR